MTHAVLWQFRQSHFNEKARWALDWKRLPHVRRSLLPGLHVPPILWLTGQKSVPVLQLDGRTIHDSTRIIAALEEACPEPPLYPRDPGQRARALELEELFDTEIGPHVRRALFFDFLPHTEFSSELLATECTPSTRRLYRLIFPGIRAIMRMDMRVDAVGAELGRKRVGAALDRIEAELGSRDYLVGDSFSVADLTAAALLSVLVWPAEFPYRLPGALPEPAASWSASVAQRPAGRWVLEMYRRHRGRSAEVAA